MDAYPIPYAGEMASIGAALIWSVTLVVYRLHGQGIPARTMNLIKNVVAVASLAVTMAIWQPAMPAEWSIWVVLMVSGVIGLVISDTAMFAALPHLGAQLTSATQCLAPPLAAVLAWWMLDETLTPQSITGMAITMTCVAGVVLVGRRNQRLDLTQHAGFARGVSYALLSAITQALGIVLTRQVMDDHFNPGPKPHVLAVALIRYLPSLVILAVLNRLQREPGLAKLVPTPRRFGYLIAAAFAGSFVGFLLYTAGTLWAKAGVSATLSSTYPIWIIPLAVFVLGEPVSKGQILCTLGALAGIVLLSVQG